MNIFGGRRDEGKLVEMVEGGEGAGEWGLIKKEKEFGGNGVILMCGVVNKGS